MLTLQGEFRRGFHRGPKRLAPDDRMQRVHTWPESVLGGRWDSQALLNDGHPTALVKK